MAFNTLFRDAVDEDCLRKYAETSELAFCIDNKDDDRKTYPFRLCVSTAGLYGLLKFVGFQINPKELPKQLSKQVSAVLKPRTVQKRRVPRLLEEHKALPGQPADLVTCVTVAWERPGVTTTELMDLLSAMELSRKSPFKGTKRVIEDSMIKEEETAMQAGDGGADTAPVGGRLKKVSMVLQHRSPDC